MAEYLLVEGVGKDYPKSLPGIKCSFCKKLIIKECIRISAIYCEDGIYWKDEDKLRLLDEGVRTYIDLPAKAVQYMREVTGIEYIDSRSEYLVCDSCGGSIEGILNYDVHGAQELSSKIDFRLGICGSLWSVYTLNPTVRAGNTKSAMKI